MWVRGPGVSESPRTCLARVLSCPCRKTYLKHRERGRDREREREGERERERERERKKENDRRETRILPAAKVNDSVVQHAGPRPRREQEPDDILA